MKSSVEHTIAKCMEGNAPDDIIKDLIEETPDIFSIRTFLVRDLHRSGVSVNQNQVKAEESVMRVEVDEEYVDSTQTVLDTYHSIYPEIEFFLVNN